MQNTEREHMAYHKTLSLRYKILLSLVSTSLDRNGSERAKVVCDWRLVNNNTVLYIDVTKEPKWISGNQTEAVRKEMENFFLILPLV